MSAARLFDVYVLLEGILLDLPMNRLFLLKAVSKTWKATIESSIKLQRRMFLAPDGDVMQPSLEDAAEFFPDVFDPRLNGIPTVDAGIPNTTPEYLDLTHTVIGSSLPDWSEKLSASYYRAAHVTYTFHGGSIECDTGSRILLPRICRSMYLCQPPIAAALLDISRCEAGPYVRVVVYDRGGITLGLLADTFARVRAGIKRLRWNSATEGDQNGSEEDNVEDPFLGIYFYVKVKGVGKGICVRCAARTET